MNPAIARLTTRLADGSDLFGTAWLCGPDLALTASHCVMSREKGTPHPGPFHLAFSWEGAEPFDAAEVVWRDAVLDAALLRLPPGRVPAGVEPLRLGARPPALPAGEHYPWFAEGFPAAHEEGMRLEGTVTDLSGRVGPAPSIQLLCDQGGHGWLEGASGSAVRCGDAAIGLIRYGTLEQHVIFATAVEDIAAEVALLRPLLAAPPSAKALPRKESAAAAVWREKLEFLLQEEALATGAATKFALKKRIEEAWQHLRGEGGSPPAVALLKEKLNYLEMEQAITADAAARFELKKQIDETRKKIAELGG